MGKKIFIFLTLISLIAALSPGAFAALGDISVLSSFIQIAGDRDNPTNLKFFSGFINATPVTGGNINPLTYNYDGTTQKTVYTFDSAISVTAYIETSAQYGRAFQATNISTIPPSTAYITFVSGTYKSFELDQNLFIMYARAVPDQAPAPAAELLGYTPIDFKPITRITFVEVVSTNNTEIDGYYCEVYNGSTLISSGFAVYDAVLAKYKWEPAAANLLPASQDITYTFRVYSHNYLGNSTVYKTTTLLVPAPSTAPTQATITFSKKAGGFGINTISIPPAGVVATNTDADQTAKFYVVNGTEKLPITNAFDLIYQINSALDGKKPVRTLTYWDGNSDTASQTPKGMIIPDGDPEITNNVERDLSNLKIIPGRSFYLSVDPSVLTSSPTSFQVTFAWDYVSQ